MSQSSTVYNFDVELADSDRGVYETLALRVARHPSESEEYLLARLLAYMPRVHRGHRVLAAGCAIRTTRRSRFAT